MTGSSSGSPGMVSSNWALEREGLNAEGSAPGGAPRGLPLTPLLQLVCYSRNETFAQLLLQHRGSLSLHAWYTCNTCTLTVRECCRVKCRPAQYDATEEI